jgi:hypothetical protein
VNPQADTDPFREDAAAQPNLDDGRIDYTGYSLDELREALAGIDRSRYPANFANLVLALALRAPEDAARATVPVPVPPPKPPKAPLTAKVLTGTLVFSAWLLASGLWGLRKDDVFLPTRGFGEHLHGREAVAWVAFFGIAFVANGLCLLGVTRNASAPGPWYRTGRALGTLGGLGLLAFYLWFNGNNR